ncbi:MAG: InlB B-repeat-containing protein [Clostridia bacterium]|nr:InlB B-repeat-containing protein [Clostridia bacterium]
MKESKIRKSISKGILLLVSTLIMLIVFAAGVFAATPYEITKSDGALVRTSYSEKASSVRREAKGNIIWVVSSTKNSAGNIWYQLSDGNWIYSGNVKSHSCSWTWTSGVSPTCTTYGINYYRCNKCGQTTSQHALPYGHKFSGNVCTVCGDWNSSSIKSKSAVNNVKYYVTTDGAKVHSGPYGACATTATLSRGTEIYVTEMLVNASNNTWYRYSGGYIFSDYVKAHNSCAWNSGTVTKKATCTASGTKVQYCTICGRSQTTTLSKVSHKFSGNVCTVCGDWNRSSIKSSSSVNNVKYYVTTNGAKVHSGPYGACATTATLSKGNEIIVTGKFVNASDNVWYKYSGGYIFADYVKAHNSCKWNSGTVTKKATCTATGTKVYTCTICSKTRTDTISKVSHKYENNVCTVCGGWNTSSLKSSKTVNNVKYYVIKDASKVRTGPYNSCKIVNSLSKGTEIVVTRKVVNASGNTWYKYSGGYIFGDYVKEHNSCKWNSGTVTKKATCAATGTKVYTCTICSKTKTEAIAKVSHKYEKNVCTVCGGWNTSSLKSSKTVNNAKYCVIVDGANVRTGPYNSCKTVKKLSKGTVITVTKEVVNADKNTWYKLSDGNWIYSGNVTQRFTIKYNVNGGESSNPKSKTFLIGSSFTITTDKPTRVGYIFKGWGTSKTTTKVSYNSGSSYKFTKSMTLYAVWEKCSHAKYYGGICTTCKYEYKLKETSMSAVYRVTNGNGATAWSRPYSQNSKKVKVYDKGADLTIVAKVTNINEKGKSHNTWYKLKDGSWVFSGNVTERFMVKYNANGGKNAPDKQYFLSGKSVKITSSKPTREKYVFKGWATDSDSKKVKYKAGDEYDKDKNLYLYAVWEKCNHKYNDLGKCTVCKYTYTITVTKSSGTVVVTEKDGAVIRNKPYSGGSKVRTAKYMEPLTIVGYTINAHNNKWFKLSDGNWIFAGNVESGHKVTYKANGGKKAPASTGFVSGKLTISSAIPTRSGYTFMGWSTSNTAKTATYKTGDTYKVKKNITLYAVWKSCNHNYKNNYGVCKNCKAEYPLTVTSTSNTVYEVDNRNGTYSYKRPYAKSSEKVKKYSDESLLVVTGSAKNQYGETWCKLKNGNWILKSDLEKKTTYNTMYDVSKKLFSVLEKTSSIYSKSIDGISYYSISSKNGRVFIAESAFTEKSKNTQLKNVNKKINQTLNSATNISTEQTFVYNRKKIVEVPSTSSNSTPCANSKKTHNHVQWELYLLTVEAGISGGKTIVTKCTVDGIRCYDYCTASEALDTNRTNTLQSKTSIRPVFSVGVTPIADKNGKSTGYYTDFHLTGKGKEAKSLTLDDYVDLTTGLIDVLDSAGKVAISTEPVSAAVNIYKLAKSTWKFSTTASKLNASAEYKSAEHIWLNKLYYKDEPSKLLRIYDINTKSPIKLQNKGDYLNMDIMTYNFNDSKQNINFSLSIK